MSSASKFEFTVSENSEFAAFYIMDEVLHVSKKVIKGNSDYSEF